MSGRVRLASDRFIVARRVDEDRRANLTKNSDNDFKLKTSAQWEETGQRVFEKQQVQAKYNHLKKQDEVQLEDRRKRLGALLAADQALYREELDALEATPQQRRDRLADRARQLRETREKERKEQVDTLLYTQWRSTCDDLRTLDSKELVLANQVHREKQVEDQRLAAEARLAEENKWARLWEYDRQQKLARELAELDKRKEMDRKTKEILDSQRTDLQKRKELATLAKQEETRIMNERRKQQEDEAAAKEVSQAELAKKSHFNIAEYNAQMKATRDAKRKAERDADLKLINSILSKEQAEDQAKMENKEKLREEHAAYRTYLQHLKENEGFLETELERLRLIEQEQTWQKRQLTWQKEQLARDQLMADVYKTRQDQIVQKELQQRQAKEVVAVEKTKVDAEVVRLAEEEAVRQAASHKQKAETRAFLKNQMAESSYAKEQEAAQSLLEAQQAAAAEAAYRERLEREKTAAAAAAQQALATGGLPPQVGRRTNFARKKTNWYS